MIIDHDSWSLTQLPAYLAASEDVSTEIKINGWWKSHNNELPNWTAIYKLFLLVQPSSAAAEYIPFLQNKMYHWKIIFVHLLCCSVITNN